MPVEFTCLIPIHILVMMIILKDGDPSPGGGGLPYERGGAGMLVASLRGVNFIFWSR